MTALGEDRHGCRHLDDKAAYRTLDHLVPSPLFIEHKALALDNRLRRSSIQ